jgi:hypothetical protein
LLQALAETPRRVFAIAFLTLVEVTSANIAKFIA